MPVVAPRLSPAAPFRPARRILLALLLSALLPVVGAGMALAGPGEDGLSPLDPVLVKPTSDLPQPKGIAYQVRFSGVDGQMAELLGEVSGTRRDIVSLPASEAQLQRRAQDDLDVLLKALHSKGYFRATVDPRVDTASTPAMVDFVIDPGTRFTLKDVAYVSQQGEPVEHLPPPADIGLPLGQGFDAEMVLDAERRIIRQLADSGHPFAKVSDRRVVADFAQDGMLLTYVVSPGPLARFGPVRVEGETEVDEEYIRSRLPWQQGEPYSLQRVEDARKDLFGSGLFAQADFVPDSELDAQGRLPMTLKVKDRTSRTFRIGGTYSTDLGPGTVLSWEDRNLLGGGEDLTTKLNANLKTTKEVSRSLETTFTKPQFLADRQALKLSTKLLDERPQGFDSQSAETTGVIERTIGEKNTIGGGLGLKLARIDDDPLREASTFGLVFLPVFASRDRRDVLLDPSSGYLLRADAAPYTSALGNNINFLRYTVDASAYAPLLAERRLILALRARYGQILGTSLEDLPATERFYAGGGGSVRGYEYKSLSSLDGDKQPIGGLSIVESSAELRWRFLGDYGITAFMDGGRAYSSDAPDPTERFFLGAGAGVRYYTNFGPIRLDFAFPLNRREGVDPNLQIYGSIGQAF